MKVRTEQDNKMRELTIRSANKRFFPGVEALMRSQLSALCKSAATGGKVASVRSFTSMSPQVSLK